MKLPKIAAIIPVFNRPRRVVRALESVVNQTYLPSELVVVDDGSTDDTAARVRDFLANVSYIRSCVVEQSNSGPAAARNTAVRHVREADWLAMLDSDDFWPADHLEQSARWAQRHPDSVAICRDSLCLLGDPSHPEQEFYSAKWVERDTTRQFIVRYCKEGRSVPNPTAMVVRRDVFNAIGGFDPSSIYSEDWQVALRLSLRGPFVQADGEPVTFDLTRVPRVQPDLISDPAKAGDVARQSSLPFIQGEAVHMSELHQDRSRYKAQVLDRFIVEDGGADVVPARFYRPLLAKMWYRAGRKYVRLGEPAKAKPCFDRALQWKRWHVKARWWSIRCNG